MAADINTTELREPDPIAAEAYVDGAGGKVIVPIPPKGTYNLQTTEVEWGATKDGYLQATLTEKVVAPGLPFDGHEVRFDRINTKKWPNREGSSMADYLRAHGVGEIPTGRGANDRYKALVTALVNRVHEAGGDWEAFNTAEGINVKGMENFPQLPDGTRQDFIQGKEKKVFARFRVGYRVSKVPSGKSKDVPF